MIFLDSNILKKNLKKNILLLFYQKRCRYLRYLFKSLLEPPELALIRNELYDNRVYEMKRKVIKQQKE